MQKSQAIVPLDRIESRILLIRSHRVMLDPDLARVYQVSTKRLNEQVKRNRFPNGFMFQLVPVEAEALRSQFATSNRARGGRPYRPYVFTEHGAVMLASVLNSPVAVQASVQVVRAFIRLREMLVSHKDLARKLAELEQKYDVKFKAVFDAIRELMGPPEKMHRAIGFHGREK